MICLCINLGEPPVYSAKNQNRGLPGQVAIVGWWAVKGDRPQKLEPPRCLVSQGLGITRSQPTSWDKEMVRLLKQMQEPKIPNELK